MSDLISRKQAVQGVKELFSMGECYCDKLSIVGMLNSLPAAESEQSFAEERYVDRATYNNALRPSLEQGIGIIRCADCKWWDRLEEGHPYGYCLACRSSTHTERWEISIYRQCKSDFFCADAEPIEDEDKDDKR